ncbi:glycosyltransferase [Macrococcoides caseolyticum]|uniref:glycosyltransferase n=1 Tax=Macrococcoides caseolyticum TaxID=69966 RepID=UPI0012FED5DD|nr:glycosyltransferase [Macrococcus caseolyticus]
MWQNVISKHQKDLIEEIFKQNHGNVAVIYCNTLPENRENIGWNEIIYKDVETYFLSDLEKNKTIIDFINSFDAHVFSGISSYPLLKRYFNYCKKNKKNIFLYSEDKNLSGIKGKLRYIFSIYETMKYKKDINGIFAIGVNGKNFFNKIGYDDSQIIEFGYYIKVDNPNIYVNKKINLVYVGELTDNKGVDIIISSLSTIFNNENINSLHIYGEGKYKEKLNKLSQKYNKKLFVHGNVSNDILMKRMNNYDYLLLLSKYDGWGVVINEASLNACGIICTDKVGASHLLNNVDNCYIIKQNVEQNFKKVIFNLKPLNTEDKLYLKNEAFNKFSVEKAASRFLKEIKERANK